MKTSRADKSELRKTLYLNDKEEDNFSSTAFHHVYVVASYCDCLLFVPKIIEACRNYNLTINSLNFSIVTLKEC